MSFKVKINEAEKSDCPIIRFFTKINLIFKIVDCALIQTAIHGHNFSQATKRSFDLVMRNSSRYMAVTEVNFNPISYKNTTILPKLTVYLKRYYYIFFQTFTFIFYMIMIIISVIVGLIMYGILDPTFNQQESYIFEQAFTMPLIIFCIVLIMVFPYFFLLSTAVKTILLCTFNDVLENDELIKKSYLMNVQLHKMLTE